MVLLKKRNKEIPLALAEVSSEFSPNFPIVIILLNSIAKGRALGIRVDEVYHINLNKFSLSIPLPIRSSIYTHRNCMIRTNHANRKVIIKGPTYCLTTYQSSFLKVKKSRRFFKIGCFATKTQRN